MDAFFICGQFTSAWKHVLCQIKFTKRQHFCLCSTQARTDCSFCRLLSRKTTWNHWNLYIGTVRIFDDYHQILVFFLLSPAPAIISFWRFYFFRCGLLPSFHPHTQHTRSSCLLQFYQHNLCCGCCVRSLTAGWHVNNSNLFHFVLRTNCVELVNWSEHFQRSRGGGRKGHFLIP